MTRARDLANLVGSGNFSSTTFTATEGQTAFTISHTQGFVQVFMNGLLLDETADYTSNGTAITLTSGASAGDEIEVVAYNTFSVGDGQTQTAADARYVKKAGDTMTGALGIGGVSKTTALSSAAHFDTLGLIVDDNTAYDNVGVGGGIAFRAKRNSSGTQTVFGAIDVGKESAANDSYTGSLRFYTNNNSTGIPTKHMNIDALGRVTKPNQPAFFARHTTAAAYSSAYVTNWSTITYNVGNHFAGSTGIFTSPVAGVYQVNAMIGNNYAQGVGNYQFKVNDIAIPGFVFDPFASQNTWATNVLVGNLKVNANDTVKLYCNGAGYPDNSSWTSWSMYLLG